MEFLFLGVKKGKDIITELGGRIVVFVNPKTSAVITDYGKIYCKCW